MTQQRRDAHSTEFGLWTRGQREIKSELGFITTNLDFIWADYQSGLWMLLEEKRFRVGILRPYQVDLYQLIHRFAVNDPNYRGFHKVVFERTSPDDGWICLDNGENVPERTPGVVTRKEFLTFLRFEAPPKWYATRCIHPFTNTTVATNGLFTAATITPIIPFGRAKKT